MNQKNANILFIILAFAVVLIPVVTMNLLPDQVSVIENRSLADIPSLSEGIVSFMNDVDSYVDDRIGFRDDMMRLYNRWNYTFLQGNHGQVISGDNGWLFYKDTLADYTGTNINVEKTTYEVQILSAIDDWCKARGITFIFTVGPNKSTIYDQYMPDSIFRAPVSNLDNLICSLAETDINFFCPKDELIAHRDEKELYYRQDTHWNEYGSRYLFDAIVSDLGLPSYDIPISDTRISSGDLLTMQGTGANKYTSLYATVPYQQDSYVEEIGNKDFMLHSADTASFVCYRDSFTSAMLPYFSYYFHGPVYWSQKIDFDYLEENKPQYLVLCCVERYLDAAIVCNADILE